MQLSHSHFDPETVRLMGGVCDEVWREVQRSIVFPTQDDERLFRGELAQRVLTAVAGGVRDPRQLRAIALASLEA